jgi:PAS domain S-box-containing protein
MDREHLRLKAVNRFTEIDSDITNDLRDIVDLASQICSTPVAIITLLDKDVQWFKIAKGTDVTDTPRTMSFCNYTIEQDGVLVVPDMSADERYNTNPLVASDPNVRFYAGSPLITKDGYAVGSLCVVDFERKELNEHQQKALKTLSKQVINLMELNWSLQMQQAHQAQTEAHKQVLEDSAIKLKALFDSTNEIHLLISKNLEVLAFNNSAADYIYSIYEKDIAVGDSILDYVDPKIKTQLSKYFTIALKGRMMQRDWQLRIGTPHENWRQIKLMPIKNNTGEIIGVAINSVDITKRKMQEKQISIQNEALTRIAIIQSHELRRPVASLLGIMSLMKLEEIDFGYFNMMEVTVNELDEKIRIIVQDSENTINNHLSIVA